MSDAEKSARKSSAKPKAGKLNDWIVRGVVFGILGVVLVMALLDYQAKKGAEKTAEAWRTALKAKGENNDLLQSEFDKVPISGSPVITVTKSEKRTIEGVMHKTYTWKGTIRSYVVKVGFGLGNDPPVDTIDGPGEPQ